MNFSEYLRESSLSPNREIINRLKESLSGIISSEKYKRFELKQSTKSGLFFYFFLIISLKFS